MISDHGFKSRLPVGKNGKSALRYRTVVQWVKEFNSDGNEIVDLKRIGQPFFPQDPIDILSNLFSMDCRWTVRELFLEVSVSEWSDAYGRNI